MRFKIDENLPVEIAEVLRLSGYDAATVIEQHLGGSRDAESEDSPDSTSSTLALTIPPSPRTCSMRVISRNQKCIPSAGSGQAPARRWTASTSTSACRGMSTAGYRRLLILLLLLAVALCSCGARADEMREEALASIEGALEMVHEEAGMIGSDAEAQAAWTEGLLALDKAAGALSACEGKADDCLAASLSALLDADRKLLLVEQLGGVARVTSAHLTESSF